MLFVTMFSGTAFAADNTTNLEGIPQIRILESNTERLALNVSIPKPDVVNIVQEKTTYNSIGLQYSGMTNEVGKPSLPYLSRFVLVPKGSKLDVTVDYGTPVVLKNINVYPAQPSAEDRPDYKTPPFTIDKEFYKQNTLYPREKYVIGEEKILRGATIREVTVYPVQYNPSAKELTYYPDIALEINIKGGERELIKSSKRSIFSESLYSSVILNYNNIRKDLSELGGIILNNTDYDYLIVTHPNLKAAADSLAALKTQKGIRTKVVTTTQISNSNDTNTLREAIKQYIKNAYDTNGISYLLLMGDSDLIPVFYNSIGNAGTDLYYATVDGSDYVPDLSYGRIPANTLAEAQTIVGKINTYETNPPTTGNTFKNLTLGAYFQDDNNDKYEDREYVKTIEGIAAFMATKGYTPLREYTTNSTDPLYYNNGVSLPANIKKPAYPWTANGTNIVNDINNGTFLVAHRDHGAREGWWKPAFDTSSLPGLTNNGKYPVVFSLNCQTGWFDNETDSNPSTSTESFAEQLLAKSNAGAAGVVAATRNSSTIANNALMRGMFDCLWNDFIPGYPAVSDTAAERLEGSHRLGDILNYGKLYNDLLNSGDFDERSEYEIYHVLGDPTMEVRTTAPYNITLRPVRIFKLSQTLVLATNLEEGSIVSLIADGQIVARGIPKNGQVILKVPQNLKSTSKLCVTFNKNNVFTKSVDIQLPTRR